MKITHYIPITALALAVLAGGTGVLAQQAGEASDSTAAPDAPTDMPMMEHGDMRGDSGMRDMMGMMRHCMKMMESMGMETDTMPMMNGMDGDSAAPSRGQGMMEDGPMNMDGGTEGTSPPPADSEREIARLKARLGHLEARRERRPEAG